MGLSKKIIVVGKNSVIGKCYCKHAEEKEYLFEGLSSKECDFLNAEAVANFFKKQKEECAVVFFAAVNKRVRNDYQAFADNVQMIQNLIHGIRGTKISSIIFFSATDVYGLAPQTPITEQNPVNPESYYSLAKAVCEKMLLSFDEVKIPATVLRIPGAYAMPEDIHGAIGKLIRKVLKREKITLSNGGNTLRDYVEVGDINRVVDLLIEKPYRGVLNLASGQSASLREILTMIEGEAGLKADVTCEKEANDRDFNLVFDMSLFKSLFPRFHFTDLREGIKNYIRQEKENL